MGQRLNIEITNGDKTLANSYYHWSAYTDSSLELTRMILNAMSEISADDSDLVKAVKLLEVTGAGFNDAELERINKNPDKYAVPEDLLIPCTDRNEGLLAVTFAGIEETRNWEEGRVEIDIENKRVSFDVIWQVENINFEDEEEYEKCTLIRLPLDVLDMSFDEFREFDDAFRINGWRDVIYKCKTGMEFVAIA